MLIFNLNI